jgi:hypothetical protein
MEKKRSSTGTTSRERPKGPVPSQTRADSDVPSRLEQPVAPLRENGYGVDSPEFKARVARKAFELFEHRGGDTGHDVEDWLEAERIIKEEMRRDNESVRR